MGDAAKTSATIGENDKAPKSARVLLSRAEEHRVDEIADRLHRYLPTNYAVVRIAGALYVVGIDHAGWTLAEYVIPRCATGLIFLERCAS